MSFIITSATQIPKEPLFLSHSLELADALIAATALNSGLPLLTANDKHYRMIDGLNLHVFRPD
jgi:predicted nucleic acid-binding protein